MITQYEAELLGALTGDGFIGNYGTRKQIYLVQFTGDKRFEKEYFLFIKEIINSIIPSKISFQEKDENTLHMRTYSKELFEYIHKTYGFPAGKKENISVPKCIIHNNILMKFFIRGLFDTDGCLHFDSRDSYAKPYPRLILYTTSHNLFKQASTFLSKYFKIHTRITRRNGVKPSLIIEIYGHKQHHKWKKIIGFSNMKHIRKLFYASVA